MIKELVMEVTNSLPDTATFDDIIEAIYTRIKIEKGLNAVKEEKGLSTEELRLTSEDDSDSWQEASQFEA